MKTKLSLFITALALIGLTYCTKDSSPIEQTSVDLADDDAVSEVAFDDVFTTVDNATVTLESYLSKGDLKSVTIASDSCPIITITNPTTGIWPKTITVDYGDGCTGFNGSTRKGKIIITVTERRAVLNSTRTVTFENYYFNGIKVEGTKVVKNIGPNNNQNIVFEVTLTDGKLILPNSKTIERSFEHQREWVAGWLTKNIWDDECLITGTATGKNIDGVQYTHTITSALHWKRVCEFFTSGVMKFEREGAEAVELDYGTGECDAIATLKRGENTKQITLKHRHRSML
ncbi:MAG: hypothetical protein U0X39_00185 [Bacteroidales bacterium]